MSECVWRECVGDSECIQQRDRVGANGTRLRNATHAITTIATVLILLTFTRFSNQFHKDTYVSKGARFHNMGLDYVLN